MCDSPFRAVTIGWRLPENRMDLENSSEKPSRSTGKRKSVVMARTSIRRNATSMRTLQDKEFDGVTVSIEQVRQESR